MKTKYSYLVKNPKYDVVFDLTNMPTFDSVMQLGFLIGEPVVIGYILYSMWAVFTTSPTRSLGLAIVIVSTLGIWFWCAMFVRVVCNLAMHISVAWHTAKSYVERVADKTIVTDLPK